MYKPPFTTWPSQRKQKSTEGRRVNFFSHPHPPLFKAASAAGAQWEKYLRHYGVRESGLPPAINKRKRPARKHKRERRAKKKDTITKKELGIDGGKERGEEGAEGLASRPIRKQRRMQRSQDRVTMNEADKELAN